MRPVNARYRWVILGLVWLLYFVFGVYTRSLAPLVTPIIKDLNLSYVEMGFILGSWQLTYILFATLDGAIIDRWGLRKALLAGVIIMGLSEILRYFATGFAGLLLCVSLIGVGGPMISIGAPKAISLWFAEKERGLTTGIYMTAPTVGGLLVMSTANSLIMPLTGYSWRLAFALYGTIAFGGAFLWWLFGRESGLAGQKSGPGVLGVFRALVRRRLIQVILIMGLFSFTVSHGFESWLPQILEARGIAPATAGLLASLPLLVGIPSVLLVPRLTPPGARGTVITLLFLVMALAILLVALTTGAGLIAGLLLFGAAMTPALPLLMLILMGLPEVGSQYLGSAAGMFFCIAEVGGFGGPFLLGTLRNITGDFLTGTILVAALALLTAGLGLYLKTGLGRREKAGQEPE
jgi:cyanate permease